MTTGELEVATLQRAIDAGDAEALELVRQAIRYPSLEDMPYRLVRQLDDKVRRLSR